MDSGHASSLAPAVSFRRAQKRDVSTLTRWSHADHVRDVIGDAYDWDWPAEVGASWQEVWIASVHDRDVGVLIVLDAHQDPARYWGSVEPGTYAIDIWIGDPDALHRGYGTQMMHFGLARAFDDHAAQRILLDPLVTNAPAIGFYRHLGFRDVGPRRFGDDDCLVLELTRTTT